MRVRDQAGRERRSYRVGYTVERYGLYAAVENVGALRLAAMLARARAGCFQGGGERIERPADTWISGAEQRHSWGAEHGSDVHEAGIVGHGHLRCLEGKDCAA